MFKRIIKSNWWFLISLWCIAFTFGTLILIVWLPILFIPVAIAGLLQRENPVKYFKKEMEGGLIYDLMVKYPYINEVLKLKKWMEEKGNE